MAIRYYMDDDIAMKPNIAGLRRLEVVVERYDAGLRGALDTVHLAFAADASMTLVTANHGDFMRLHGEWSSAGRRHGGIVIVDQAISIGNQIRALHLISSAFGEESIANQLPFASNWIR